VAISVVKSTGSSGNTSSAAAASTASASAAAAATATATADTVLATAAVQYKGPGDSPPSDAPAVDEGGTELIRLKVNDVYIVCSIVSCGQQCLALVTSLMLDSDVLLG
jgi:hypothetical protein